MRHCLGGHDGVSAGLVGSHRSAHDAAHTGGLGYLFPSRCGPWPQPGRGRNSTPARFSLLATVDGLIPCRSAMSAREAPFM